MVSSASESDHSGELQQAAQQEQVDQRLRDARKQAWFAAAETGDIASMAHLLKLQPELINATARPQRMTAFMSALQICVWRNHSEAAAWLLDVGGADLELADEVGMTALLIDLMRVGLAIMFPYPLVRSRCIDASARVEAAKIKRNSVKDRSSYGSIDTTTLDILLTRGANVNHCNSVNEKGETALLLAVNDGLTKHVQLLIANGADIYIRDAHERTTLEIACEYGYVDVAQVLLANAEDFIWNAGEQALRGAVCHDFPGILELLLHKVLDILPEDARVSFLGQLLHLAVEYDALECVQHLLTERGVDINWRNPKEQGGHTAVHLACVYRRSEILRILLSNGADADLCCEDGDVGNRYSPYHIAILHHGEEQVDILAAHDANINLLDQNHETPLVLAAKQQVDFDVMEQLIHHGANFVFPTSSSRDSIAPILASWLHNVAPANVPVLVQALLNTMHLIPLDRYRRLVEALLWSRHTEEALLVVLLMVISLRRRPALLALQVIRCWSTGFQAHTVVQKLLVDALSWSEGDHESSC